MVEGHAKLISEVGRLVIQRFGFETVELQTSYGRESEEFEQPDPMDVDGDGSSRLPKTQVVLFHKQLNVLRVTLEWHAGEVRWARIDSSAGSRTAGEWYADLMKMRFPEIVTIISD